MWTLTRERESWARLNFYAYLRPFIHCLYLIYAPKFYMHSHRKITRQWAKWPALNLCIFGGLTAYKKRNALVLSCKLWLKHCLQAPSVKLISQNSDPRITKSQIRTEVACGLINWPSFDILTAKKPLNSIFFCYHDFQFYFKLFWMTTRLR